MVIVSGAADPTRKVMREDARNKITELIERFDRNSEVYRSGNYNETQVRREFIDPFFDALGWDVANKAGYAEQYKDVVHEDSIKVGVSLKAPDYSFRIGGQRKFFLEAKKPQVRIKEDVGPAYQLRRYAWSAKLPLSIVTDFEEFAVYDCRTKPDPSDKVSLGRIAYYTYDQYLDKFDEIYDTFSKEAVLKGSFDRYIESTKVKKGTGEVDREFLKEIEKWRDSLARNLAIRNPELDIYELNFAVQHTIDRIIFLRICEDRGIEGYGRLQGLTNGANVYERLLQLFTQADKKYNSGLFDFKADRLSHNLKIDDKVLKEIIENLYYPKSPYEFSVLGADILGNVYEQFLGKVIRLTAGHQAKVEEKPEVKKAGGVYYTPQYIVEYIVKNTVGRLLEELPETQLPPSPSLVKRGSEGAFAKKEVTPKDVSKIHILDPACGSGSFLIGAYQYLLDWHLKWYRDNNPEKHAKGKAPAVYLGTGKEWRLTTQEKKRILLNNIYGVDIDRQAVEVTKLSLLLKLLENENEETVGKTMALFQERVLPSLENNIKCGNSLIGPDFFAQTSFTLPSIPSRQGRGGSLSPSPLAGFIPGAVEGQGKGEYDDIRRINVFDWEKEFPQIFPSPSTGEGKGGGGFDAVIGNPPYGAFFNDREKAYIKEQYKSYKNRYDSYIYFIEKAISLANRNGRISFITPELWLRLESAAPLRQLIAENTGVESLRIFGENVFENAVVHTVVFNFVKGQSVDRLSINDGVREWHLLPSAWTSAPAYVIDYRIGSESEGVITKIEKGSSPLIKFGEVIQGITPYDKYRGQDAALIKNRGYHFKEKKDETCGKWLSGKDVNRYDQSWSGEWLSYGSWLAAPREARFFSEPRILFREVPGKNKRIQATYVSEVFYYGHSITPFILASNCQINLRYLLGISNSKLISWYGGLKLPNFGKDTFPKLNPQDIKQLPIRTIDFNNPKDKALHDKMVSLVDRMLDLNKKLQAARIANDRELLDRQIKITDDQIDRLVYELYGLTEEESGVIEGILYGKLT